MRSFTGMSCNWAIQIIRYIRLLLYAITVFHFTCVIFGADEQLKPKVIFEAVSGPCPPQLSSGRNVIRFSVDWHCIMCQTADTGGSR